MATAPVLLLWGAEDQVIPPPPGAVLVEGAGHMPQLERASRVADLLAAHLEAAS